MTPSSTASTAATPVQVEDLQVVLSERYRGVDRAAAVLLQCAYEHTGEADAAAFHAYCHQHRPLPLPMAMLWLRYHLARGSSDYAQRSLQAIQRHLAAAAATEQACAAAAEAEAGAAAAVRGEEAEAAGTGDERRRRRRQGGGAEADDALSGDEDAPSLEQQHNRQQRQQRLAWLQVRSFKSTIPRLPFDIRHWTRGSQRTTRKRPTTLVSPHHHHRRRHHTLQDMQHEVADALVSCSPDRASQADQHTSAGGGGGGGGAAASQAAPSSAQGTTAGDRGAAAYMRSSSALSSAVAEDRLAQLRKSNGGGGGGALAKRASADGPSAAVWHAHFWRCAEQLSQRRWVASTNTAAAAALRTLPYLYLPPPRIHPRTAALTYPPPATDYSALRGPKTWAAVLVLAIFVAVTSVARRNLQGAKRSLGALWTVALARWKSLLPPPALLLGAGAAAAGQL